MIRQKKPVYFFAVALLPLLFILQNQAISQPLRQAGQTVLKPFMTFGDSTIRFAQGIQSGFGRLVKSFRDQGYYEARIDKLQRELTEMNELRKENERLKKLLKFREDLRHPSLGARVIGWDPSPWRKTILIDKGSKQKIKKDMTVVVPEGLVGRVVEVYAETARVLLLIDPDARVSAMATESRAQGIVGSKGATTLDMTYLELDSGVAIGEEVVTSSVGGLFPKGIAIGKIVELGRAGGGLHLKAQIEPAVNFSKLEEVLCLEGKKNLKKETKGTKKKKR